MFGATYEGDFAGGYMHGHDTYIGEFGDTFTGLWASNLQHGRGTQAYANGDVNDGHWRGGEVERTEAREEREQRHRKGAGEVEAPEREHGDGGGGGGRVRERIRARKQSTGTGRTALPRSARRRSPPLRMPQLMESKKATKRRHRGDTAGSRPPKLAKPGDADDTVESTAAEFAKPVFLVGAPLMAEQQPSYSVFMVDAAAVAGGNDEPPPIARALAGGLPGAKHGMSFVAAHSKHGTWIVGVGGQEGRTVIYDPSTPGTTLEGPELSVPKEEPILISHGGKVYAISRRPKVHVRLNLDFPPWFQSLSFKKGVPCIYRDGCPFWKGLPPPPCFPCSLDPWEFRYPPDISVSSYAAVGSHILLSLQQEGTGTFAFHVVEKTWEKVCDKNLPFVGQAVPIGGSLFAACGAMPNNASVLHMSIEASTPVVPGKLTTSLIQEFTVTSEGEIPRLLLCSLGRGSFCSIRLGSCRQSRKAKYLKHLQIILTAFQMDNVDAILTACQTEGAKAKNLHMKQENQIYKFKGGSRFPVSLHMPMVAALSM